MPQNNNETRQSTLYAIKTAIDVVSSNNSIQPASKNIFINAVENVAKNYWHDLNFEGETPSTDPISCITQLKGKLIILRELELKSTAPNESTISSINSAIMASEQILRELGPTIQVSNTSEQIPTEPSNEIDDDLTM